MLARDRVLVVEDEPLVAAGLRDLPAEGDAGRPSIIGELCKLIEASGPLLVER